MTNCGWAGRICLGFLNTDARGLLPRWQRCLNFSIMHSAPHKLAPAVSSSAECARAACCAGGVNVEAAQAIADRKRERVRDSQLASTSGRDDSRDSRGRRGDERRHSSSSGSHRDRCTAVASACLSAHGSMAC